MSQINVAFREDFDNTCQESYNIDLFFHVTSQYKSEQTNILKESYCFVKSFLLFVFRNV